jgi:hypothetical protein
MGIVGLSVRWKVFLRRICAGLVINPWLLAVAFLNIIVSLAAQNYGHGLEHNQVHGFTGAGDFMRRLYAEQFCNLWRFLFSGQWCANFKSSRPGV